MSVNKAFLKRTIINGICLRFVGVSINYNSSVTGYITCYITGCICIKVAYYNKGEFELDFYCIFNFQEYGGGLY